MTEQQNIPPGFKPSPLGPIPNDWEVKELVEVADFLDGKRKPIKDEDRSKIQGIYPYYGASGIIDYVNDYIFDEEIILLGEDGANIINRSSPLAFKVSGKVWVNNHAHVLRLKNGFEIGFVTEFLESLKYDKYNTGTAQPKLNKEICSSILILCPPFLEQKRIAEVLSTWDNAITKVQALLAQKELRKKWLMQQLLTGKKRLKKFSGKWQEINLKNCFQFIKSYSISRDGLSCDDGDFYCIHYGDIHAYYETDFLDFANQTNIPRIIDNTVIPIERDFLKEGDVIIADVSEDYEGVGETVVVKNLYNKIAVGGLHTIVLRDFAGKTTNDFRAYLFAGETVKNELRRKATGTSVYSVTKTTLEGLYLNLPSPEEQTAITLVLQAADKEIQLEKNKLEKLKEQKKGLMQVLLTGKKRLKIND
jgi:type I restriction enzyme S subunit